MSPPLTEVDGTDEFSISDIRLVLARFNIHVGSDDPTPLEEDHNSCINAQYDLTISQRIKTLTRESRCRTSYLNTHQKSSCIFRENKLVLSL